MFGKNVYKFGQVMSILNLVENVDLELGKGRVQSVERDRMERIIGRWEES